MLQPQDSVKLEVHYLGPSKLSVYSFFPITVRYLASLISSSPTPPQAPTLACCEAGSVLPKFQLI